MEEVQDSEDVRASGLDLSQSMLRKTTRSIIINPEDLEDTKENYKFQFKSKTFFKFAGPGLLMSIAFLDPGNIAADLDAGITGGYGLLWVLFWSTVLGCWIQVLSARLGVVTQRGMSVLCREQYPQRVRLILWLMTELAIIGSDIQEIIGSAIALRILFGIPIWVGALITVCDTLTFMFLHYFGVKKLEAFFAFLIGMMAATFAVNFFLSDPNWGEMAVGTVVPIISTNTLQQATGLLGGIIMPHNLYLHSSLVLTRKINSLSYKKVADANIYNTLESSMSLLISFLINFMVVSTFAYYVNSPQEINLYTADIVLQENFGSAAKYIWAIGLLAAGQSSTMTGAYAGQFVAEGFLNIKMALWLRVLLTRSLALVPALFICFLPEHTIKSQDTYLNMLQAVQLPFALLPLLKFVGDQKIMGEFTLGRYPLMFGWFSAIVLITLNMYTVLTFGWEGYQWYFVVLVGVLYFAFIIIVIFAPTHELKPAHLVSHEEDFLKAIEVEDDTRDSLQEEQSSS